MKLLEKLVDFVIYPIKWFWINHKEAKTTSELLKTFGLLAISLGSFALLIGASIWLLSYMLNYHMDILVLIGLIIWVYLYVKNKYQLSDEKQPALPDKSDISKQAEDEYLTMRKIIFQLLRKNAPDIGGKVPRLLSEIEIPEAHYNIANDICFYQFQLIKQDLQMQYSDEDLIIFQEILQTALSHAIDSGNFPYVKMEKYRDQYGNWFSPVVIDTIEDVGTALVIQSVFTSDAYANFYHERELNISPDKNNTHPDESWDNHK